VVIWETLIAAFAVTFRDPALLLRAATGGLLLLAATTLASIVLPPNPFTLVLMLFAPIAAYSHFAVNWYRVILLGPQGLIRPALRWDRRHWRVFGFGLLLGGGLLALGAVLAKSLPLPPALIALCLIYPAARSSFLFPAIAVEEPYSLAYAWRHTKGQGGRLTVLLLLAGLPLMLAVMMIVSFLFLAVAGISLFDLAAMEGAGSLRPGDSFNFSPLATLSLKMIAEALTMGVLAVLCAIIALAFRRCTGWVPAAAPPAPSDEAGDDSSGP
jgi:hypothetical protein